MKRVWAGMFKRGASQRREWLRDASGVNVRRAICYKTYLAEIFSSPVARELRLSLCIELGERGTIELPESKWDDFERELRTLSANANRIDALPVATQNIRGRPDHLFSIDNILTYALDFIQLARRHSALGYVVAIAAE